MIVRKHLVALGFALGLSTVGSGCVSHTGPNTTPEPTDPSQLQPPPSGQGVQLKTDLFTVPASTEVQNCYFFQVSQLEQQFGLATDKPLDVHRVQIVQKAGSHHMNLFKVNTIKGLDPANGVVQTATNGMGACFVSSNWSDWPLVANTQDSGAVDWSYPDGVANSFEPTDWLMLQTHYVNATSQNTPSGSGQVGINLYTIPDDQITAHLGTIFATNQSIRICQSNPTPSYSATCQFNSSTPVTVIGANGHFHSRGREFDIYSWDGTSTTTPPDSARFYQSTTWNEPPMLHSPDLNLSIPAGGGIWYSCSYQWVPPDPSIGCQTLNMIDETKHMTPPDQLDCCYTFGGVVEEMEHCNAFVYYYPAQASVNCF